MRVRTWAINIGSILVFALCSSAAFGANSVFVESKMVAANATGVTVGVYVENDVELSSIAIPLEFRIFDGSAYITNSMTVAVQGRVTGSGLMDFTILQYYGSPAAQSCSGPVSNTYQTQSPVDFVSPDGFLWAGNRIAGTCLSPGSDGGTPTLLLTFDVNGLAGSFIIDSCCMTPLNHLQFADCGFPPNPIIPDFTPGTIEIVGGASENRFTVESKIVETGETGVTAGIYLENVDSLNAIGLPVEFRSIDPGAYIANTLTMSVQGRVGSSAITQLSAFAYFGTAGAQVCSGPLSSSFHTQSAIDFVSPDACAWNGTRIVGPCLAAGADVIEPSFLLTFDVTSTPGSFVIDTCCIAPGNHVIIDVCAGNTITPEFTPGIIEIHENLCPTITGFEHDPVEVFPTDVAVNQTYAIDPEGDPLVYYLAGGPGTVDTMTGEWTYTTTCDDVYVPYQVTIGATDREHGACDEQSFDFEVQWDPLLPNALSYIEVFCGELATQTISATGGCPDEPLSFSQHYGPGSTNSTGDWTYQTNCADTGEFLVGVGVWKGYIERVVEFLVYVKPVCACECFGDPADCQAIVDVFDVVACVDEAFRNGPPVVDPNVACPFTDNNVTCDAVVDVFDVVAMVDVAFRNADPAVAYCDPCP